MIKMKKRIKKIVVPCFLSILCGCICGHLVYGLYDKKIESDFYGEKIYLIQAGAYSDYDNMVKNTTLNNYIYYKDDDGLFKSIIGLTEEKENIEKIKNIYGKEVIISEYYSNDLELNKNIKKIDKELKAAKESKDIQKLSLEILNLYKDKKATLTQITS